MNILSYNQNSSNEREIDCIELNDSHSVYDGSLSEHINVELKHHQLVLLKRCIEHENIGLNAFNDYKINEKYKSVKTDIGVIADKVGSGKSYVLLALIMCNPKPLISYPITTSIGNGHVVLEMQNKKYIDKSINVIVIPHMLVKQWSNYIETFCSSLKYYVVNKKKNIGDDIEKVIDTNDIMLVTGTFYRMVCGIFYINNWRANRLIFDEVDSMNTPSAHYMSANFYWFVTASYKNLMFPIHKIHFDRRNINNSYVISNGITNNTFVKNLFMTLTKHIGEIETRIVDRLIIKNEDSFVDRSFSLPEPIKNVIRCRSPVEVNILSGLVSNEIINSLNAGDMDTALEYINPHNLDTEENIINQALSDLHKCLVNNRVRREAAEQLIYNTEEQKNNSLRRLELEKNSLQEKIDLMKKRIDENKLCIICYNEPEKRTISKCCKNSFCFRCISMWLSHSKRCPLCKNDSNIEEDFYIIHDRNLDNQETESELKRKLDQMYTLPSNDEITSEYNKFQNLERLINCRKSDSKFLIFSDFDQSFYRMYDHLNRSKLRYSHVKGNSVNSTIEKYRKNELDALLVNSKNYGSGLNLENTTDVILFHKFEGQIEKQVIGRAQRPGRSKPLRIWYFLNENEM